MAAPSDPSQDELWLAMREAERATSARISELEAQNQSLIAQLDAVYASRTWQLGRRVIDLAQPMVRARRWLRMRRSSPATVTGGQGAPEPSTGPVGSHAPDPDAAPFAAIRAAVELSNPPFDDERAAQLAAQLGRMRRHGRRALLADELTEDDRMALLELETALALGTRPGPPDAAPSTTAGTSRTSSPHDMVVVDGRRLQSPWTATDSSRSHALALLDALRDVAGDGEVVALLDPAGGSLDPAAAMLVDRVVFAALQVQRASPALFVSLAPMDHTLCPAAPFVASSAIACVALLTEAIAGDRILPAHDAVGRAARLHGLSRYDLALAVTPGVAAEAGSSLGWSSEQVLITGVSARRAHAPLLPNPPGVDSFVVAEVGVDRDALAALGAFAVAVRPPRPPARELRLVVSGPLTAAGQATVRRRAADLGVDDRIDLRPGVVGAEANELLAGAVAVLLPARPRGFPLLALDAIGAGHPVVATDDPTHRDVLGPGPWLAAGEPDALGRALRSVLLDPADTAAAQRAHAGTRFSADAVRDRIVLGLRAAIDRTRDARDGLDPPTPIAGARTAGDRPTVAVLIPDLPPGPARAAASRSISALAEEVRVVVHSAGDPGPELGDPLAPLDCRPFLDAGTAAVLGFVDDDPASQSVIEFLTAFGGACFVLDGRVMIEELSKVCTPLIVEDEELARRIQQATLHRPVLLPAVLGGGATGLTIDGEVRLRSRAAVGYADGRLHLVRVGALTTASTDRLLLPGALAWLVGWGHDPVLHLIGEVEPEVAAQLEDATALLGLRQRVLVDPPDPAGAAQHLLAADVAVQVDAGREDTDEVGLAIQECIACGLPTVCREAGPPGGSLSFVERTADRTSPLLLAESIDRLASLRGDGLDTIERERQDYLRAHRPTRHARRLVRSLGLEPVDGT